MNNIIDVINKSNSILVMAHENPDGDAIGSAMAIYHALNDMNKDIDVLMPETPPVFMFLNSIDKAIKSSDKEYDLAIVVDCSTKERLGQINNEFDRCKTTIVIDHHISNTEYADINYVEGNTSSCAQVIYYLFKRWNIVITKEIGECLMIGCLTDTNGFGNDNIDRNTFLMAADMMGLGIDVHKLYYLVLSKKNQAQYLLTKITMDRLEMLCDGKIAFSYVSKNDLENVGAMPGDHEGLVDIGRNIDGVEVSIFMREDDGYRVSFRSNGMVDVSKIASKLGGGGHKMAAGTKIKADFEETRKLLIDETIKELSV